MKIYLSLLVSMSNDPFHFLLFLPIFIISGLFLSSVRLLREASNSFVYYLVDRLFPQVLFANLPNGYFFQILSWIRVLERNFLIYIYSYKSWILARTQDLKKISVWEIGKQNLREQTVHQIINEAVGGFAKESHAGEKQAGNDEDW